MSDHTTVRVRKETKARMDELREGETIDSFLKAIIYPVKKEDYITRLESIQATLDRTNTVLAEMVSLKPKPKGLSIDSVLLEFEQAAGRVLAEPKEWKKKDGIEWSLIWWREKL